MSSSEGHNLLEIDDLSVSLRGNRILDNISLRVKKGHIHALTGPNGAGKTTLMRSVMGGMPHKGTIRFLFRESSRVGYVPQFLEFDHSVPITVFDFLFLMMKKMPVFLGSRKAMRDKIEDLLKATDCSHLIDRCVGQLSGGEFRRVLLAQALSPKPELLLLDEPASNIDEVGIRHFEEMLINLRDEQGITILMVCHSMDMISRICDAVTAVNRTIFYDGPTKGLDHSELLQQYTFL
ncbi:MAG: metal ABC transporter ATP-binding protein [Candidatus Electrothrix aestuarii]|uniref:Metal ABC transporter ATP-binding protein n=1 Tax=Candidatus Electrothrix aestuarii TaxID=3062594 RepID=A0AAU8LZ62_9BACT|nr:metal ABC transporter ATP-binding protein [Candidatus Electrothrix aestuarii]